METVPRELADGIYGNDLRLKHFRNLLIQETEWDRLEAVSRQGFYIFHLAGRAQIRIPIEYDFYNMDKELISKIWNMKQCNPESLFSAIFSTLQETISPIHNKNTRYALTMPKNDFCNYNLLLNTYPNGKIIYIDRDIFSAVGSTIYRRSTLLKKTFLEEIEKEFTENNSFIYELIHRSKSVLNLQHTYPDHILSINFNDLIINTENVMRKVCNWLSVPFTEHMLKATFLGKVIDNRAVGCIQDDMKAILTQAEFKRLQYYIDQYTSIYTKDNQDEYYTFPASLFKTNHSRDSYGNIIIDFKKIDNNIIYGPYMNIPQGIWSANFMLSGSIPDNIKNTQWTCDCVDTYSHTYFRKNISINELVNKNSFIFNNKNPNACFEFRIYGHQYNSDTKIIFKGVKIKKQKHEQRLKYFSFENMINFIKNI